jgi:hypothetical protein
MLIVTLGMLIVALGLDALASIADWRRASVCSPCVGLAFASTGAWAQGFAARDPVILAPGIQLSTTVAGTVELTPDQKLARAYALCAERAPEKPAATEAEFNACGKITAAWRERWRGLLPPSPAQDNDADSAFIEEVARGLK